MAPRAPGILACAVAAAACGATQVETEAFDPQGTWQSTEAGRPELTLDLASDGSFERVEAELAERTCTRDAGMWRVEGDRLVLSVDTSTGAPAEERLTFEGEPGRLQLEVDATPRSFAPLAAMVSCVDYGFGAWSGDLRATVDGSERTFEDLSVELDVDGGTLRVTSLWRPCPDCPLGAPDFVIAIDAGRDPLRPGLYPVDNAAGAPRTMFGFFHPDPESPDFQGFSTERLSPPGSFDLLEIGDDRIRGTFSFRGNPRADGQVAADGSTFTQVTQGVLDLSYR